jgi:hypothetical protein
MAEKKLKGTQKRLSVDKIKCSKDVQPRVATDSNTVKEYRERIEAGDKLPRVVVFFDGTTYWLAEGFHRLAAHKLAGHTMIDVIVIEGSKADAQWHALQTNKTHGLRRSNDDKIKAVQMAFAHPKGKDLSDRALAELVGVSATMVAKHRPKNPTANGVQSKKRVGRDGRVTNTAKIGKKKAKPTTKPETEKPTASASAPDKAEPHDDSVDEHTDERDVEPEVVQPEGAANGAADDLCSERELYPFPEDALTLDPECSEAIIDEIEGDVTFVQEAIGEILRNDEIAALPAMNHLSVLLKRLEIAADNVASFLAHQRGLLEMGVPADIEEGDGKVQDAAEEKTWTA